MAYNSSTDFIGLLRLTSGGVRSSRMPGLDWLAEALERMGLINISVSATAPVANQATTAWFKPATPSWSGEGQMYLWNPAVAAYQIATPALWIATLAPVIGSYQFQNITVQGPTNIVAGTTLAAIQRNNPASTNLVLPNLEAQFGTGRKLQVVDFSTNVANHTTIFTTPDGATIMAQNSFQMTSNPASLASATFTPSPDLNSWVMG